VPLLNDATMRGQIHDDFRGAQIREDDRRAALRVYPSPSYVHPREAQTRSITASLAGCTGNGSRDASSNAEGDVIVFQTTCNLPAKRGGVETVMLLRRDQCAKQLATKAGDPRCDEKQWMRHTKAAPLGVGIEPSITADGRFTVFVSDQPLATKALPSDWRVKRDAKQSAWVVYMQNILTNSTYAVAAGMNVGQGTQPQISPDGTAISFVTTALPENGPGEIPDATPDVFQIKPEFGVGGDPDSFGEPICASCKDAPGQPAGPPASSANGVFIAYSLGDTSGGGTGASLWLRNMVLGSTNQMVPPTAGAISSTPSIDYSGNTIAFTSNAAINTADGDVDTNGKEDVFTYDACCNKFTRISRPDTELPNPTLQEPSFAPTISGDGRRLAFISRAQNLMGYTPDPGDNNTNQNVYAYDIKERIKRRFSRNASGQQSNGDSARPAMNYTGSIIVFDSAASNFDGGDTNGVQDVVQMSNPQAEFVVFGSGFD
jgi:Tol biopolymer transport system component